MAEQIAIDFTKRARGSDPETSHQAAARVVDFAHGHFALILGSLKVHGPQTIHELSEHTGLDHVAIARRTAELHDAGRIEPTGATRPSPKGRQCREWALVCVGKRMVA